MHDCPKAIFITTTKIHIHFMLRVCTPLNIHWVSSLSAAAGLFFGRSIIWAVQNPGRPNANFDCTGFFSCNFGPIIIPVEFETLSNSNIFKQPPKIIVVGGFLELQLLGISDKSCEFLWKTLRQLLWCYGHFSFHDHLVLLLRVAGL